MPRRFVSIAGLVMSLMFCFHTPSAWAQAPGQQPAQTVGGPQNKTGSQLTGTRKQLATIIFAGLAGAILGLSTLSFYGKPQEKLDNIAVGAALGIIGGAIYTTYQVATVPYEIYDEVEFKPQRTDAYYAQNTPRLHLNWEF